MYQSLVENENFSADTIKTVPHVELIVMGSMNGISDMQGVNNDGMYVVGDLHTHLKDPHTKWKYLSSEDIQTVEPEQLVNCEVEGQWDHS